MSRLEFIGDVLTMTMVFCKEDEVDMICRCELGSYSNIQVQVIDPALAAQDCSGPSQSFAAT